MTKRFAYTLHNVAAHPAMEVLHLLGFDRAAKWVHDKTLPKGDRKQWE